MPRTEGVISVALCDLLRCLCGYNGYPVKPIYVIPNCASLVFALLLSLGFCLLGLLVVFVTFSNLIATNNAIIPMNVQDISTIAIDGSLPQAIQGHKPVVKPLASGRHKVKAPPKTR